jgi:hypothetical protein
MSRRGRVCLVGVVTTLLFAGMAAAWAGTPQPPLIGHAFRISGTAALGEEGWPRVAYNPDADEYLVVWHDGRLADTRGDDIYGRRVSGDGLRLGRDFRISGPEATANEVMADVAYDPVTGRYLVIWVDQRTQATRGLDIYGRFVSGAGHIVGADFRISGPAATGDENDPVIAYNPTADQFLVVWEDTRDEAASGWEIYGNLLSADGQRLGSDFRVSGDGAVRGELAPAVAYGTGADEYLVVWMDERNDTTRGRDIYGRVLSASGQMAADDFAITGPGATTDDSSPAVAYSPVAGAYLVVWGDFRTNAVSDQDVYGRLLADGGATIGDDFRVSSSAAKKREVDPVVAYDGSTGGYLVVWEDSRNAATRGPDIYGRYVASDGGLGDPEFSISGPRGKAWESGPALAYDPAAGQFLVAWMDGCSYDTRMTDVRGRLLAG